MQKRYFLIVLIINFIACQKSVKIDKNHQTKTDTFTKKTFVKLQKPEYYFISATSGLNFREKPNGKILGKLPLNTLVKVVQKTNIYDEILDNNNKIKGEWYGIENEKNIVYVFSAFLSGDLTFSKLKIYYVQPFETVNVKQMGFVNISDTYFMNFHENKDTLISENDLLSKKKSIKLSKASKNKILKKIKVSEKDTLFILNLNKDKLTKFCIKDIATIAYLDDYSNQDDDIDVFNYEIGFDLKDSYKLKGDNLASIGNANPFLTGNIKEIVWKKINNDLFPKKISEDQKKKIIDTYTFTYSKYKYYVQNYGYKRGEYFVTENRNLIIQDTIFKKITSEIKTENGESTYLNALSTNKNKIDYYKAWTGNIFKNKPPIIYGLETHSFGCSKIKFIENKVAPIEILCNNRH
ncbi:SH3 domain-containing protein [Polaribacter sp.]|uniref:SH3 domain-containing protein n=1 Tax=Polaribacter sp. TaxID=1920175 RepID=UPI003F6BCB6F